MEPIGVMVGTNLVVSAIALGVAAVLYPLFWLWMLVDALVRDPRDYPGGDPTEKLVWALLMVVANWTAVVYWLVVYVRRGRTAAVPAVVAV